MFSEENAQSSSSASESRALPGVSDLSLEQLVAKLEAENANLRESLKRVESQKTAMKEELTEIKNYDHYDHHEYVPNLRFIAMNQLDSLTDPGRPLKGVLATVWEEALQEASEAVVSDVAEETDTLWEEALQEANDGESTLLL